jgi:hypothetical protein
MNVIMLEDGTEASREPADCLLDNFIDLFRIR